MGGCGDDQCWARLRCTSAWLMGHGCWRVGHRRRLQPSGARRIQKSLRSISYDGPAVIDCLGWSFHHDVGKVPDNEGESGLSMAGDDICSTRID